MLRHAPRGNSAERGLLFVLAAAFAGTAGVHTFLADTTSEWWPLPIAAVLALAASWCLATAVRWHDHGRREWPPR